MSKNLITIKNNDLVMYLKSVLNKSDNAFSQQELNSIVKININGLDVEGRPVKISFQEIKYFEQIESIIISNLYISNEDMAILQSQKKLKKLTFERCSFENEELIKNIPLEELHLIYTKVKNFNFVYEMTELSELSVIKGSLNFKKLNALKNLKYLNVSSSIVSYVDYVNLPNLERVNISYSNIENVDFTFLLRKLNSLSLDQSQIDKNKNFLKCMIDNGKELYFEDVIKIESL